MSSRIIQDSLDAADATAKQAADSKLGRQIGAEVEAGKSWAGSQVNAAIEEGETLIEGARETAKAASAKAASMAERVATGAGEAARRAGSEAADLGERAYASAGQAGEYAEARIREKPLMVLLLATLVGGVIGHFLSKRR